MQYPFPSISGDKEACLILSMKPVAERQMWAVDEGCIECGEDRHGPWSLDNIEKPKRARASATRKATGMSKLLERRE